MNRIIKLGSVSLLASVLTKAINLISVPIFSRLLSTSEYGQVEVFMTYVNIFIVLLGLDFHVSLGKGILDHKEKKDKFLCSNILLTSIWTIALVIIMNLLFEIFAAYIGLERWLLNMVFLYSYAMFLVSFKSAEYTFFYEYKKNMFMSVSIGILNVLLSIILLVFFLDDRGIVGRIIGATIPTALFAAIIYIGYLKKGNLCFNKEYNNYSLRFGLPLIPHSMSHMILSSADKIMINSMISSSASGIYSLTYTMGLMIQVVTEAMFQVYNPWLYRQLQENNYKDVKVVQRPFAIVYSAIAIMVLAISPEIVLLIGGLKYKDGIYFIMWIVFSSYLGFNYSLYVSVEFFYRKTIWTSIGSIAAAVINIVLNLLFLPQYGYMFAAISTVISYGMLTVFHAIIVNHVIKRKCVDNINIILLVSMTFVVAVIMNEYVEALGTRILIAIFMEIFLLIFLLKSINEMKYIDFTK